MSTNFPSSLDTSSTIPAESANTVLATNHVTAHQNIQDAIEAIEAKVGADGSAVTTSHDYKLSEVTSTDVAVGKTATQTLTNKTLTSPTITSPTLNLGSDAEGDTYYRNSSGALVRLPRGTDNYILKMNGNVPNWEAEAVIADATSSLAGLTELATAAEISAGTATGSDGPLVVTPDQLALSTPVFNGSGLTDLTGANMADLNYYSGVGNPTTVKTYWNFNIPYLLTSNVPSGDFWTNVNMTVSVIGPSFIITTATSDSTASILTTNGIFCQFDNSTTYSQIEFSSTKKIITEFGIELKGVGTEQQGFGLSVSNAPFINYDDASVNAACFTIDSAGALYGHTSNGGGTSNHTETQITGITLTNSNTYRIEIDPGVDVKFYVNGVLKATNTTNLPSSGIIRWGFGSEGNSDNNDIIVATVPYFAIEK